MALQCEHRQKNGILSMVMGSGELSRTSQMDVSGIITDMSPGRAFPMGSDMLLGNRLLTSPTPPPVLDDGGLSEKEPFGPGPV